MSTASATKAVVVSRYREDISELVRIIAAQATKECQCYDVIIYNKGPENVHFEPSPSLTVTVQTLPNVGRDAHTLLHHITTNYDSLHNMTVFLPGSAKSIHYKTEYAEQALSACQAHYAYANATRWGDISRFTLDAYTSTDPCNKVDETPLQPSAFRPLGAWFRHVFGYEPEADSSFLHSYWLIAALPRLDIRDCPLGIYRRMLETLNTHSNSETVHYAERALVRLTAPMPRIVWLIWFQGWDSAPPVVQRVRRSWEALNPNWEVRALDDTTLPLYVKPPYKAGMTPAAKSDMVRLHLLAQHGGIWADATMLCMQPLRQWVAGAMASEAAMWMFHNGDMPASWFMLAQPHSYIMTRWAEAADAYWAARDVADNYFWMDGLFRALRDTDSVFRALWQTVPALQCEDPGSAAALAGKVYGRHADVVQAICENVPYAVKLDCHKELTHDCNGSKVIQWVETLYSLPGADMSVGFIPMETAIPALRI